MPPSVGSHVMRKINVPLLFSAYKLWSKFVLKTFNFSFIFKVDFFNILKHFKH